MPGSAEFGRMLAASESATTAMATSGVLLDSSHSKASPRRPLSNLRGGEAIVIDGPFAEVKELTRGRLW